MRNVIRFDHALLSEFLQGFAAFDVPVRFSRSVPRSLSLLSKLDKPRWLSFWRLDHYELD